MSSDTDKTSGLCNGSNQEGLDKEMGEWWRLTPLFLIGGAFAFLFVLAVWGPLSR